MELIKNYQSFYVIRFDLGEQFPENQKWFAFLKKEKIKAGFFWGLGAVQEAEISFYDLNIKKYKVKKLKKSMEIASLVGNIANFKNKPKIHAHLVLGDKNQKTYGGHLENLIVGGTLEIFLIKLPSFSRKLNSQTGLLGLAKS